MLGMASAKQIAANRINALESTGPRTEAGKAISGQNARTHGLLSQEGVADTESQEEFEVFRSRLLASLEPVGEHIQPGAGNSMIIDLPPSPLSTA